MQDITLFKSEGKIFFKKISKKEDLSDHSCDGFLIDTKGNEKEARRIVESIKQKDKSKKIAIVAHEDNFNRRIVETIKCDYLVSPENSILKDSIKQRDSGINHVVAKEMSKKNIFILINLSELNNQSRKEKIKRIARIMQNIKISRKANCKIKFVTFAESEKDLLDEKQIQSIGFSLGMSSQQVKSILI